MLKAYDLMDWGFIYFILEGFGFDELWIDRISGVSQIADHYYALMADLVDSLLHS